MLVYFVIDIDYSEMYFVRELKKQIYTEFTYQEYFYEY